MAKGSETERPKPPGEILRERLAARAITVEDFAQACGTSLVHMQGILNWGRGITPQMAIRIATALGDSSPEYWMSLRAAIELYDARQHIAAGARRATRPRPFPAPLPRPVAELQRGGASMDA